MLLDFIVTLYLSSTGFLKSLHYSLFTTLTANQILLMTAVGLLCFGLRPEPSTFHWWTHTTICLNKPIPAVQLHLWKTHHCDSFRHVWLFKQIFRDVPSCKWCYLSQNKNRINWLMLRHLLNMAFSSCASFFFSDKKHWVQCLLSGDE